MRSLALCIALLAAQLLAAQTIVRISNVKVVEKEVEQTGSEVTIPLKGDEGSERSVIFAGGDLVAKTWVKVSTHNVARSSLKNTAVNVIFEIDLDAGKKHDNKRVEKIFYLDEARTATITQRFSLKDGLNMRVITLTFDVEIL